MNNTSKKSSVTWVSSLTEFIEWVNKINEENILFRGLANDAWGGESSLYVQLKKEGSKNVGSDMFLKRIEALIDNAHKNGDDIKDGCKCKLKGLELLANLQHKKADLQHKENKATCLIDFTKTSIFALYFACKLSDNKTGKVVAFSSDNTDFKKIPEYAEENIRYWFEEYKKDKKPWIFFPPEVNNRIISQQSVFVFGSPIISLKKFHVCKITNKQEILKQLEKNGISGDTLNIPGESPMQGKKFPNDESAIEYYDKVINSNPENSLAYYHRGNAKIKLGNFQDAIRDYDEAIRLKPHYQAYCNRGNAQKQLRNFHDAISDYDDAIKLNPKDWITYNNRGVTKMNLGNFQDAIRDYDKAIKLSPKFWESYYNGGLAKNALGNFQDAIRDYDKAIKLNPNYSDAYYKRGIAKNRSGDIMGGASDCAKATEIVLKNKDLSSDN